MDIVTEKDSMYEIKKLDTTSDEFAFIRHFFYQTQTKQRKRNSSFKYLSISEIYKIHENNKTDVSTGAGNLMLFHGTDKTGVTGVLREGFKNSNEGYFGKGVYMTDSSHMAYWYAFWCRKMRQKHRNYVFVNEVLGSEKMQVFRHDNFKSMVEVSTEVEHPFCKHHTENSRQPDDISGYKVDALGRRYRNVKHDRRSMHDEYVADGSVVVPRYLIVTDM